MIFRLDGPREVHLQGAFGLLSDYVGLFKMHKGMNQGAY
jgi:hypothetical protein